MSSQGAKQEGLCFSAVSCCLSKLLLCFLEAKEEKEGDWPTHACQASCAGEEQGGVHWLLGCHTNLSPRSRRARASWHIPETPFFFPAGGNPRGRFALGLVQSKWQVYVKRPLDREDQDHYSLRITATDGLFVTQAVVDVHVSDVNDNSPVCDQVRCPFAPADTYFTHTYHTRTSSTFCSQRKPGA